MIVNFVPIPLLYLIGVLKGANWSRIFRLDLVVYTLKNALGPSGAWNLVELSLKVNLSVKLRNIVDYLLIIDIAPLCV